MKSPKSPTNHRKRSKPTNSRTSTARKYTLSSSSPPTTTYTTCTTTNTNSNTLHTKRTFDRPIIVGNKVIDSPDNRPPRSCLVRTHSALFCCMSFCPCGVGECVSKISLSGKRTKGHSVYKKTTAEDRRLLDALDIEPKSIERLHEVFVQIDRDGSGEISLTEFFRYFSHKRRFPQKSKFSKKVFQIMDADGSGELSFVEFTVALWNFCTFDKKSLLRFSFELYDADDSGYLDLDEIKLILREVYGKHKYKSTQASQHILKEIETMIETGKCVGGLNLATFNEFCRHHPALLYPAFELQQALQQNVLGSKFWIVANKKRRNEKKRVDALHANNHGRDRRSTDELPIATEDMSYKELIQYLEMYGKTTEEERVDQKAWWETSSPEPPFPATMERQLRVVGDNQEDEERARAVELKLNRTGNGNGNGLKYAYQAQARTHSMSQIALAKKLARSMKSSRSTTKVEDKTVQPVAVLVPWTCGTCQRMNTASYRCRTCKTLFH